MRRSLVRLERLREGLKRQAEQTAAVSAARLAALEAAGAELQAGAGHQPSSAAALAFNAELQGTLRLQARVAARQLDQDRLQAQTCTREHRQIERLLERQRETERAEADRKERAAVETWVRATWRPRA